MKTFKEFFESSDPIKTVKFKKWTCRIDKGKYPNNRVALELVDIKNEDPILYATVNLPHEQINDDEVIIKNYSENEGILDIFIDAKVISKPVKTIQENDYVKFEVCKLLI